MLYMGNYILYYILHTTYYILYIVYHILYYISYIIIYIIYYNIYIYTRSLISSSNVAYQGIGCRASLHSDAYDCEISPGRGSLACKVKFGTSGLHRRNSGSVLSQGRLHGRIGTWASNKFCRVGAQRIECAKEAAVVLHALRSRMPIAVRGQDQSSTADQRPVTRPSRSRSCGHGMMPNARLPTDRL